MNQKIKKARSSQKTTPFEVLFSYAIQPWVICLMIGFFYISYRYIDLRFLDFFYTHFVTEYYFLEPISQYPLPKWYCVIAIITALFFRYIIRRKEIEYIMWFIASCELICGMMDHFLKVVFGRARPMMWITHSEYGFYRLNVHGDIYRSFPSGHASAIMAFVLALGIVYPRKAWVLWSFGLLWSFMRMVVSHHYFSDVWVGAYFDILEIGVFMLFLRSTHFMKIVRGA